MKISPINKPLPQTTRTFFIRIKGLLIVFFLLLTTQNFFAQSPLRADGWMDGELALQYVLWAQEAIEEDRWREALLGLERAADFSNVSSDISFLLAKARLHNGKSRLVVVDALNTAIDRNRWVIYNENQALLLKAEQLIAMRNYSRALDLLSAIRNASAGEQANSAILRLLIFRNMADNDPVALANFRSLTLTTMDRFSRDPRPLRIFFEFARNRLPELPADPLLPGSDIDLMELVLRRFPFLVEQDPCLAWMAASFMRHTDDARRYITAYRAGSFSQGLAGDFFPHPDSISLALNFGLIDDFQAVDELFSGMRGANNPLPIGFTIANDKPVIEKRIIGDVFRLLRSEEGRTYFTQRLFSFSGFIKDDIDNDGFIDSITEYNSGVISGFLFDRNQTNDFDLIINFSSEGFPQTASVMITGHYNTAIVNWERYPSVGNVSFNNQYFHFRPADFHFAPIALVTLGGSTTLAGLPYPVILPQYINLTQRTLVSFAASIIRPSAEFDSTDNVMEQIFMERGFPRHAVKFIIDRSIDRINFTPGRQVSVTEFERGFPVVQFIDLDLDGRMETMRRFHSPGPDFPWPDSDGNFNFKALIASTESDWAGEGKFITGELYQLDGSVVYFWDLDGSGEIDVRIIREER